MDIKELEITAELAHVGFSGDDLKTAWPSFVQMLGYFEAMQAADNDAETFGKPLADFTLQRPLAGKEQFRADGAAGQTDGACLVPNAGETDGRFIVIPNVL
jgi:aspartyl-tRNA(Asn)/glutamyl-tRNA(Gln) amidotransferase subunit C